MRRALYLLACAAAGCARPDPARPAGAPDAPLADSVADTTAPTASAAATLERALRAEFAADADGLRYLMGQVDLDGDGRPETVAHVVGPLVCGSGGCTTLVFTPDGDGLRLVGDVSVNRPPVVAAETRTNGWRDLVVGVAGGGTQAGRALVPFDGAAYAGNPTVAPARPVTEAVHGSPVIPALDSFEDATPLRADGP